MHDFIRIMAKPRQTRENNYEIFHKSIKVKINLWKFHLERKSHTNLQEELCAEYKQESIFSSFNFINIRSISPKHPPPLPPSLSNHRIRNASLYIFEHFRSSSTANFLLLAIFNRISQKCFRYRPSIILTLLPRVTRSRERI